MVEIIRPADRAAWLAARRQDVTASVAAGMLGIHPYTTAFALWAEKTGKLSPDDDEDNEALQRGRYLEPVGVAMLRDKFPEWTVTYAADNAYYRDPEARIGATPDAFAERPDKFGTGIVQIKSASEAAFRDHWLDPDTHEVIPPDWISVQAITEAKLTGSVWACVAVVVVTWRGNLKLYVVDIPLHDRLWNRLTSAIADFWQVADSGQHPDPDWMKDGRYVLDVFRTSIADRKDLTGDVDLDILIGRYREAKDRAAEFSKTAEILKPQIVYALGNSEAGETARWDFTARTQNRDSYTVKASSTRVLRVKAKQGYTNDRF